MQDFSREKILTTFDKLVRVSERVELGLILHDPETKTIAVNPILDETKVASGFLITPASAVLFADAVVSLGYNK